MSLDGAARIAVISDVHGNDLALAAVLDDIAGQQPEAVVFLGDAASGPLNAGRAVAMLRGAGLAAAVRGNHDRLVAGPGETMHDTDRLAAADLDAEARGWLGALPPTLGTGDLFLCHGTPTDDAAFWLETPGPGGRLALATAGEVAARAGGTAAPVMLCGHSHLPRTLRAGGSLIVNPGSVGQPAWSVGRTNRQWAETGSPDACYAILEHRRGAWTVVHRYIPYDAAPLARLATERGMPDWATALLTGRAATDARGSAA